jgi:hypothetical protein
MIKIEDITPGQSYACKYKDLTGLACVAVIVTRDTLGGMVKLRDVDTGVEMILPYDDIWDVDTVEWVDAE